jgi:hypothetical protein
MLLHLQTGEIADGWLEHKMKKIALLFVLLFLIVVVEVEAKEINFEVNQVNPVKGETVTIHGQAQPDENVTIRISFEKVVQVEDKRYTFFVPKINIPEVENRFTITAEGCKDLKVSIKDYAERYPHWVTFGSEASGEVAEISQPDIPAVVYDVLIHGKSVETSVKITITAEGYEKADEKGNFHHSYDTSSVPLGVFIVQAGNKTETVHLRLPPLPTTPARITQKINQGLGLFQLLFIMIVFVVFFVILAKKMGK